jgi:threonine/homoserine/homoserine lactone efflux protein
MADYQIALVFAGFIYIVTPGPVFLAIISLVSEQGARAGVRFYSGAISGCLIWLSLTFVSLAEAEKLPRELFSALSIICALYLFYLSARMFLKSINTRDRLTFKHPMRDGFMLALFNPKAYPVMTAVLGGVSVQYADLMVWDNFVGVFVCTAFGFLLGYTFMVLLASIPVIKALYVSNIRYFVIGFGSIFFYFGAVLLVSAFL